MLLADGVQVVEAFAPAVFVGEEAEIRRARNSGRGRDGRWRTTM